MSDTNPQPPPTPDEKAKSSIFPIDLSEVPYPFLHALGLIIQEGVTQYGHLNWLKGANDPAFRHERRKHAARHWALAMHSLAFGCGSLEELALAGLITPKEATEDHLAKVAWFIMIEVHFRTLDSIPAEPDVDFTAALCEALKDLPIEKTPTVESSQARPSRTCDYCQSPWTYQKDGHRLCATHYDEFYPLPS